MQIVEPTQTPEQCCQKRTRTSPKREQEQFTHVSLTIV